jgi:hypothetical protein
MPKINPWLVVIFYVIPVLCFAFGLGFGVRRLPDVGQPRSDSIVWIYKNHEVTQNITVLNNGFNVLTVYMRNISLRNQKPLTFTLKDSGGVTVREIHLTGYNIGDGDSVRFQFAPLTDSGGKTYQVVLSSPASVFGDAIGVGYSDLNISYQSYYYPIGRFTVVSGTVLAFLHSVLKPEFLIILAGVGIVTLGFGIRLFSYV